MTEHPSSPSDDQPPFLGFIGWGPESEAVYEALQRRYADMENRACALATPPGWSGPVSPLPRTIPTTEGLFNTARYIFVEGGPAVLEPQLAMMRLAISDRHVVVLLGPGWSVETLLSHLRERKLLRCMLLPSSPGKLSTLAYYAAPYFRQGEMEQFRALFGRLDLTVELKREAHIDVLQGLADFAPAAFATVMEAMADGVVMMGISRAAALKFLAALLHTAMGRILEDDTRTEQLREQALEREVSATGLIELESAGIRGTVIRAIQRAIRQVRSPESPPPAKPD